MALFILAYVIIGLIVAVINEAAGVQAGGTPTVLSMGICTLVWPLVLAAVLCISTCVVFKGPGKPL